MMMVKIKDMDADGFVTIEREDGKTHSVNEDAYCSVARYYGWVPCEHEECCGMTDGSVPCPHHDTLDMMTSAGTFIFVNIGRETDDPGWWLD
jgi:hypothetical protein